LKAKCYYCKQKISWRYPVIEITTALLALLVYNYYSKDAFQLVCYLILLCSFIVHFVVDWEHQILPDEINLLIFVVCAALCYKNDQLVQGLIGGAVGFFGPLGITYLFYLLKGQVGLGGGDIKLYGALGVLFGPMKILHTLIFSSLLGLIIALIMMATGHMKRDQHFAFGPAIIITAAVQIFVPQANQWISALFY
jgi:leader peptidase (prepilin peptidase)/N-methyltransferase